MRYIFVMLVFVGLLNANEVAIVKTVNGIATAKLDNNSKVLKDGDLLDEHMIVKTESNSGITILFNDNSVLVLGSNSIINIQRYLFNKPENEYKFILSLEKGSASFESGDIGKVSPENFIFKTPEGTVAIRGTKFLVKVE
jgi:hypothetical protein